MNVFIVIVKRFYISHGIDYAMPVNSEDMKVFANESDAEIERSKMFEEFLIQGNLFVASYKHYESFSVIYYLDGSRRVFQTIAKEVR